MNIFTYTLWRCDNGTYDVLQDGEVIRENVPIGAILAAPELLAALETWVDNEASSQECFRVSRAAIAKAKG